MSKTRIISLGLVAIMLAAILTNPKKEDLELAVENKAKSLLEQQLNYENKQALEFGMSLFGDRITREFVQNNVIIENYYLFSLVKIRWQGQDTPIGGGAFKKVWLSPEIDKKADEIVGILKNL
ncbi:hypothetical protein [Sphingobacterium bovistauri]|uniref:DUF4359 domain-containing protein n=1 Tax=Sphingobacterium bovistauri TaxID=2781959 RepID=A0ABS7Z587_9SPHI|nr:hypothetical protein [Sphingobacterium bovistauri]MCA5005355.1 hypothetical protein [Sphingobacterium bovistauri]